MNTQWLLFLEFFQSNNLTLHMWFRLINNIKLSSKLYHNSTNPFLPSHSSFHLWFTPKFWFHSQNFYTEMFQTIITDEISESSFAHPLFLQSTVLTAKFVGRQQAIRQFFTWSNLVYLIVCNTDHMEARQDLVKHKLDRNPNPSNWVSMVQEFSHP